MNRRSYLATVLGGATAGLAGCVSDSDSTTENGSISTPVVGEDGSPADICDRSARPEMIPAIVEPAFGSDYSGVSMELPGSTPVIGIERDGEARAYPIQATNEMVNDSFEEPILVTYCPLCSSGLTAIRRVDGRETVFENTSYTWTPPNLVMFDRETESYWSQLLAQAICGQLTGERLTLVPSTVADWGTWQEHHPDTTVLLPPPHSKTVASA